MRILHVIYKLCMPQHVIEALDCFKNNLSTQKSNVNLNYRQDAQV